MTSWRGSQPRRDTTSGSSTSSNGGFSGFQGGRGLAPGTQLPNAADAAYRNGERPLDFDEDALDDIRRYESFSTVDWITDSMRERARARRAHAKRSKARPSNAHLGNGHAQSGFDDGWGSNGRFALEDRPPRWWPTENPWARRAWWVWRFLCRAASAVTDSGVVVLVGLLIGLNMAVISIATEWLSDLKQGYCLAGWWLNHKFCCGEMIDSSPGGGAAPLPAAAIKASTAAAMAAAKVAATASTAVGDNTAAAAAALPTRAFAAGPALLTQAVQPATSAFQGFVARAGEASASATATATTTVATCPDWVSWSSWTLPSYFIYIAFAIAFSSACAYLVRVFSPYAAGSGISEIKCILAGFIINGFLGAGTLAIKSLGLPLVIASGLSVGKEGPAVHIACSIGNIAGNFFRSFARSQAHKRELLTAASAAGVAVAFGSPIGGVLFSLEEMAHNFPSSTMWRSFLCALAATVALSFMNPFRTGKLVLFQVSYDRDWHYFELLFYIVIGVFGGLYGAFVIRYNLQVQKFRRDNLAAYGVSEAATLAAITAIIGYWNMFLRIDMTESLEILFRECEGGGDYDNLCQSSAQWSMVNSLLLATVLRVILVILSYGAKVPAGIFVPSMAIGATFGRMVGILVKALYNAYPHSVFFSACQPDVPCITPGTYAFLGAAAALAGVTRITVAVVVIMFELTGALTYILPTMVVVMITKGVADWYAKGGISEQTIKFQGYPFLDKDEHVFNLKVGDVMTRDPVVLFAEGMELHDVEQRLATGVYKGFPLVQSKGNRTLLGYVGKTEVRYAIGKARHVRSSLSPQTKCYFSIDSVDDTVGAPPTPGLNVYDDQLEMAAEGRGENRTLLASNDDDDDADGDTSHDIISDDHMGLGAAGGGVDGEGDEDVLELGRWVEQNPLLVQPTMPLEVVMDLFKKMGPRVILVTQAGQLAGLVTVKDLLKVIASQEKAEMRAMEMERSMASSTSSLMPLPTSAAALRSASSSWRSSAASGAAHGAGSNDYMLGDFGGELEMLLNDAWKWAKGRAGKVAARLPAQRFGANSRSGSTDTVDMQPLRDRDEHGSRGDDGYGADSSADASTQFVVHSGNEDDDDDDDDRDASKWDSQVEMTPRASTRTLPSCETP